MASLRNVFNETQTQIIIKHKFNKQFNKQYTTTFKYNFKT